MACEQFLGVIPEVWESWIEDGHDLNESRSPYGAGDIRFKGRLLVMFGDEPTAENTAPFCRRCWTYLKPKAVTLDWLCELRDRKDLGRQPDTTYVWPAEADEFYETQMDSSGKIQAVLGDPVRRAEFKRINQLIRDSHHAWLYQGQSEVPASSRYIPNLVKEEVFERDGGQCVKCGSTRNLQYDHIIPHSRGGGSKTAANIQLLCDNCNGAKSNRFVS
jgi:hypothetical protein